MKNACIALIILISCSAALAATGDLDVSFGVSGGRVVADFSGVQTYEVPNDTAVQADGKIIVAGRVANAALNYDFLVARYNADGTLDTTFSGDGVFTLNDGTDDEVFGVAIQADGKIVAVGKSLNLNEMYVFRLNPNGTLDTTFSGDGIYEVPNTGIGLSVAVQADGKILLGGEQLNTDAALVVRLNANGTLDTSFDTDGIFALTQIDRANDIAVQSNGRIVIAGTSSTAGGNFAAARMLSNGALDTSFDTDGIVETAIHSDDSEARAVLIQSNGKIVISGGPPEGAQQNNRDAAIVRYNANGSLDTSFDGDGIRLQTIGQGNNYFNDLAQQTDGKIVAIGNISYTVDAHVPESFTLMRFNADGSIDETFDGNGVVKSQWCERGTDIALQADGKIVALGWLENSINDRDFCTQRFNADGSVDTSFNFSPGNGRAVFDFTSVEAVETDSDGKILVAGWDELYDLNGNVLYERARLIRLTADGVLDTTFADEGVYSFSNNVQPTFFYDLKVLSDGKILLAGEGGTFFGAIIIRLNADGTPDTAFSGDGVTSNISSTRFYSALVQTDGKIIGCGSNGSGTSTRNGQFVRFSATGTAESVVSTVWSGLNNEINDCAAQADGKIVFAGYASDGTSDNIFLERRTSALVADSTFGVNGLVMTDLSSVVDDRATELVLQTDGKIVVSSTGLNQNGDTDFAVVRYRSNGTLDANNFGTNGVSLIPFGLNNNNDAANALLIEPYGNLIVGGVSNPGTGDRFALTKLNTDGSVRLGFGTLGRTTTAFPNNDARINALAFQTDGKILAAGRTWNGTNYDFAIARYQNVVLPTAAAVSISGMILTADGRGLRNALVYLTDSSGETRSAITNSFGYFRFADVSVGQSIVVTIVSKRYQFAPRSVFVSEEINDLNFAAELQKINY